MRYNQNHLFALGVRNWKIIIDCIDIVSAFYRSNGTQPAEPMQQNILGRPYTIRLTQHPDFVVGDGAMTVNQPYLQIEEGQYPVIGFGTRKAGAILQVRESINNFVREHRS